MCLIIFTCLISTHACLWLWVLPTLKGQHQSAWLLRPRSETFGSILVSTSSASSTQVNKAPNHFSYWKAYWTKSCTFIHVSEAFIMSSPKYKSCGPRENHLVPHGSFFIPAEGLHGGEESEAQRTVRCSGSCWKHRHRASPSRVGHVSKSQGFNLYEPWICRIYTFRYSWIRIFNTG